MTKTSVMLMGLPCAGKSTHALAIQKRLAAVDCECPILSVDFNVQRLCDDNNVSYADGWATYVKEAEKYFWEQLRVACRIEKKFIIDRTHLTRKSRERTLNFIANHSSQEHLADLVYCYRNDPNFQEADATKTIRPGGKLIPSHVYRDMRSKLELPNAHERSLYRFIYKKEMQQDEDHVIDVRELIDL